MCAPSLTGLLPVNLAQPEAAPRSVTAFGAGSLLETSLAQYDTAETLHYVDPPYPKQTRGDGRDDYAVELSDDGHRELAKLLRSLKGIVVLSGYACPLYDEELFSDWHRVERATPADGARPRVEVLRLNASAQSVLESRKAQRTMFDERA